MRSSFKKLAVFACTLLPLIASAEEPVRHVAIFVQPYYQSGETPSDRPIIAVARQYDQQLASSDPEVIKDVARRIRSDPSRITPMTLMVLAIRHYDVGLRDESVFWFYVAKDRYVTMRSVLELNHPSLSQAAQATVDFANLAGLTINGYAFCDLQKQAEARRNAAKWVEDHPYETLFMEKIPARDGDRRLNLRSAIEEINSDVAKEAAFIAKPENATRLLTARKSNGANERYCW